MKKLIVTADDFGLTKSINDGIAMAVKQGIVTFVNFLPTGDAYEYSLGEINKLGVKEIGAHLALCETKPVTDPKKAPSLVSRDGRFYHHHTDFFLRYFLGKIKKEEIYLELNNQLKAIRRAGLPVTNISSHEHIHMMPGILEIFINLAKDNGIPSIRFVSGEAHPSQANHSNQVRRSRLTNLSNLVRISSRVRIGYKIALLSYLEKCDRPMLDKSGLAHTDKFLGFVNSSAINEKILKDMIVFLSEGTTELVTHPGFMGPEVLDRYKFHFNCEHELSALTSPKIKKLIKEKDIALIGFKSIV